MNYDYFIIAVEIWVVFKLLLFDWYLSKNFFKLKQNYKKNLANNFCKTFSVIFIVNYFLFANLASKLSCFTTPVNLMLTPTPQKGLPRWLDRRRR